MSDFVSGAIMTCAAVVALFFLRFWRRTADRFFAIFSLAFWLMALVRLVHVVARVASEHVHYVYVLRLLAYMLIIYAIIDKNRPKAREARRPDR